MHGRKERNILEYTELILSAPLAMLILGGRILRRLIGKNGDSAFFIDINNANGNVQEIKNIGRQ